MIPFLVIRRCSTTLKTCCRRSSGSEEDFSAIAKQYLLAQQRHNEADSRDLSYHATGEDRLKARVHELFRQGRYDEVDQIESQLRFPELLTDSERKIFALARNRR